MAKMNIEAKTKAKDISDLRKEFGVMGGSKQLYKLALIVEKQNAEIEKLKKQVKKLSK